MEKTKQKKTNLQSVVYSLIRFALLNSIFFLQNETTIIKATDRTFPFPRSKTNIGAISLKKKNNNKNTKIPIPNSKEQKVAMT